MGASVRIATIDWPRVIDEIRAHGMMVKAIAQKAGIAPTTLHDLYRGATREPCYSVGAKLLEMREIARLAKQRERGFAAELQLGAPL